jgi:predicted nucleic acid-binding protein
MTTTLVDSSVLLDILAPSDWRTWSEEHLAAAADGGDIAINQVIYAEVAAGFATRERLDRTLQGVGILRLNVPWTACWEAARAFVDYRRRGGERSAPLPDFFVGAHAVAARLPLLTRDPRRVRAAFPTLELIAPATSRPG